jgi:hypothetical protein
VRAVDTGVGAGRAVLGGPRMAGDGDEGAWCGAALGPGCARAGGGRCRLRPAGDGDDGTK